MAEIEKRRKRNKKQDAQQQVPPELELVALAYAEKVYEVPPQAAVDGVLRMLKYADHMATLRRRIHYETPKDGTLFR